MEYNNAMNRTRFTRRLWQGYTAKRYTSRFLYSVQRTITVPSRSLPMAGICLKSNPLQFSCALTHCVHIPPFGLCIFRLWSYCIITLQVLPYNNAIKRTGRLLQGYTTRPLSVTAPPAGSAYRYSPCLCACLALSPL